MNTVRTYSGFWSVGKEVQKELWGILQVIDEREFQLKLTFDANTAEAIWLKNLFVQKKREVPVIIGVAKPTDNSKDVVFTLFENESKHLRLSKLGEITFYSRYLVQNAHFDSINELVFKNVFLKPQFLDEWVRFRSRQTDFNFDDPDFKLTTNYKQPKPITLFKNRLLHICIYFRVSFDDSNPSEFSIKQSAYINIEFVNVEGFDRVTEFIDVMKNWYAITLGIPIGIENIEANCRNASELGTSTQNKTIRLLFADDRPFEKYHSYIPDIELIPFETVQASKGKSIGNWFKAYKSIKPVLQIFIDTIYNSQLYPQNEFLNYVFALEIYHKLKFPNYDPKMEVIYNRTLTRILSHCNPNEQNWLKSRLAKKHETNLNTRLTDLIKSYHSVTKPLGINSKRTIEKIVATRHRLVHHSDRKRVQSLYTETEIKIVSQKLRVLLQAVFLHEMGFDHSFIAERIKRPFINNQLFSKLR